MKGTSKYKKKKKYIIIQNGLVMLMLVVIISISSLVFIYFLSFTQYYDREIQIMSGYTKEFELTVCSDENISMLFDYLSDDKKVKDPLAECLLENCTTWLDENNEFNEKNNIKGPIFIRREDDEFKVLLDDDLYGDASFEKDEIVSFISGDLYNSEYDVIKQVLAVDTSGNHNISVIFSDDDERVFAGVLRPVDESKKNLILFYVDSIDFFKFSPEYRAEFIKGLVAFNVIIFVFFAIIQYFTIIRPLTRLKKVCNDFQYDSADDIDGLISDLKNIRSRNEIGRLADDISDMASGLKQNIQEKQTALMDKAKMETELILASRIQASALPTDFPDLEKEQRYDLFASMNPAKEVGGDLYDFFCLDDDYLVLIIADVAGKGVPAALFMMKAKTLFKEKSQLGKNTSQIVEEVNKELEKENKEGLFITAWYMLIELSTGKATEVNAGHTKPVLCRNGEEYEIVKNRHSMVLGTNGNITFKANEWQLGHGDRLFVYTDGVTEAVNENDEQFGNERLIKALNETKGESQKAVIEHIDEAVRAFAHNAEQFDDITMLGFTLR